MWRRNGLLYAEAEGMAETKALEEANERAEAEARAVVETSDDLRPINDSHPDPEVTFLNDSDRKSNCDQSSFFI